MSRSRVNRAVVGWSAGLAAALVALGRPALGLTVAPPRSSSASASASASPCFGAASAAPSPRCVDPALRYRVTPTPAEAEITPSAPCTIEPEDDGIFHTLGHVGSGIYSLPPGGTATVPLCVFGAPPPVAQRGFALLGDSHAGTWRAALDVVGRSLRWEGASVTMASCTFSTAQPVLPRALIVPCLDWRLEVLAWFADNPQVDTVFVSEHTSARVVPRPGMSPYDSRVAGYLAAWQALPPTVKHIVVLRDTPYVGNATGGCVDRAIAHHQVAGTVCAVPRRVALHRDPEVDAAAELGSRATVIDMTSFFCDARVCFPVIGGALVYQDTNHMTRAYSATLGPYLGRTFGQLLAAWG